MMPGDRTCLCKGRVIVCHDKSVNGKRVLLIAHLLRERVYHLIYIIGSRLFHKPAVHGCKAVLVEPVHALPPALYILRGRNECESYPSDVAQLHFRHIFQR